MKKKARFIFFGFCLLSSCTQEIESVEAFYDDGTPKRIVIYEVSSEDTVKLRETAFYQNGIVKMEGAFKNNKRDGKWTAWHQNEQLWSIGNYEEGIRQGVAKVYHENGQLHIEGQYVNDEPRGTWKWYNKSGVLIDSVAYGNWKK